MTGDLLDRLREIIVVGVNAVLFFVRGNGSEHAADVEDCAQLLAYLGVIGEHLGENIHRAVYRCFCRGNLLFLVDELHSVFHGVEAFFLLDDLQSERLQAALLCDRSPCLSFRLERTVDVFELAERLRLVESRADLFGHLFLTGDQLTDLFSALVKIAQIFQLFAELADKLIIHRAVHLFAVASDERYGVAVVEQGDDVLRVFLFNVEQL